MAAIRRRTSSRSVGRRTAVGDADLRRELATRGYAVVQLLDEQDVDALRSVLPDVGQAPGDTGDGLFNDTWATDTAWKRDVGARLAAILGPRVGALLPGHRPLGFAHIVKWPGEAGAVVAHRDPTFVDERSFRSLMLWCPLEDVDVDEGALWVVPGSHRDRTGVRVHQSAENVVESLGCDPDGPATPLRLRAGEAVLYDHALIHLSGPNHGDVPRVAVACPLVPTEAATRYAIPVSDAEARVVEIDEDFFLDHRLCALDADAVLRDYPAVASVPRPTATG